MFNGSTPDSKSGSRGSSPLWSAKKKRLDNRVQICNNSSCEVEREKIFDGAPPSVRGVGVARPPSERNFYLLKVFNIDDRKLKTVFLNLIERNDMRAYQEDLRAMSIPQLREELDYWAREIDFALSLRHELAHESMYFMVLDMIDEKEQRDYSQRWERVL